MASLKVARVAPPRRTPVAPLTGKSDSTIGVVEPAASMDDVPSIEPVPSCELAPSGEAVPSDGVQLAVSDRNRRAAPALDSGDCYLVRIVVSLQVTTIALFLVTPIS